MFEDSLAISRLTPVSGRDRLILAASGACQMALAAAFIALPLLHPETLRLPRRLEHVRLPTPKLSQPEKPLKVQVQLAPSSKAFAIPAATPLNLGAGHLSRSMVPVETPPPGSLEVNSFAFAQPALPESLLKPSNPSPIISSEPTGRGTRLKVSAGVSAGRLLEPIRPVYPPIALVAHVEGAVVLSAIISKSGSIEQLQIISGPAVLRSAAMDAVREARYAPYKLNGQAVEIQTTITVNFCME